MTDKLDAGSYIRLPRLDVAASLSLAKMLLQHVPPAAGSEVKRAARRVHDAIEQLDAAWKRRVPTTLSFDMRPLDHALDRAWSAVQSRLEAYVALPDAEPSRARAAKIVAAIFPDGLGFLKLAYVSEHAESQRRLDTLREQKLEKDLENLVGEIFVDSLRAAHDAYGKALGITLPKAPAPEAALVDEPLRDLARAMTEYAVQVLAFSQKDAKSREAAATALRPIDTFRAAARRSSATVEDAPPPDAPTPPAPPETY